MPLAEPRSAVAARPTKPVAAAWAKKVPTPTSIKPEDHRRKGSAPAEGQAEAGQRQRTPNRGSRAKTLHGAACKGRRDNRRQEHEITRSQRHAAKRERFANEYEVHVGERADEREQDTKADAECRTQWRIPQMLRPARRRRLAIGITGMVVRMVK